MVQIAILGFGTVGSGVLEVIRTNEKSIAEKAEKLIDVKYILDIRDFDDHPEKHLFTKDFEQILADPEVKVVAEVIGGLEPAYTYTKRALLAGKHVVTSNKELVATHGAELSAIAAEKSVNYLFEASVGGGIPIIKPLVQCLAANELTRIAGILNGTTNYILTCMIEKGQSFDEALKAAQELGYAERNPAADVEGHDTCRKISILASLATGSQIDADKIPTEGITKLTLTDMAYAEAMGKRIKLIGSASVQNGKVTARVSPMLVDEKLPIAGVDDVFNAVLVEGNAVGSVMFYGPGAGKLPTASAVVADIIDCAKHLHVNNRYRWEKREVSPMVPAEETQWKNFVRLKAEDKASAMAEASEYFGACGFVAAEGVSGEVAFTTPVMREKDFQAALQKIGEKYEVLSTVPVFQQ